MTSWHDYSYGYDQNSARQADTTTTKIKHDKPARLQLQFKSQQKNGYSCYNLLLNKAYIVHSVRNLSNKVKDSWQYLSNHPKDDLSPVILK